MSGSTVVTAAAPAAKVLNVNVGILGHVDSGKTSLVRALSTELSTASLDKHPQSQERGITLDLGFSAFGTDLPSHLADNAAGFNKLQFTLVDCPGHASLIRTIIGGAQIIDMMILVVDIVKGIQTQTAECLVIGEITTDNMIVVLNKVDLLPEADRDKAVERAIGRIRKVLQSTKFGDAPFVVLSAAPGGAGKMGAAAPLAPATTGATAAAAAPAGADADASGAAAHHKEQSSTVAELVAAMKAAVRIPDRSGEGPFLFAIDHCFPIKGQGTVMTGTVLSGGCKVNDTIELPEIGQERKIKSMQMFHKPINALRQGDRAGICVAGLDASLVERGLACSVGAVPKIHGAIALVKRIRFFKGACESESKFHITVGHATVMATVVFFGAKELAAAGVASTTPALLAAADPASAAAAARRAAADADAAAVAEVDKFDAEAPVATTAVAVASMSLTAGPAAAAGGATSSAAGGAAAAAPAAASKAAAPSKATTAAKGGAGTSSSAAGGAAAAAAGATWSPAAKALEAAILRRSAARGMPAVAYDWTADYEWQDELLGGRQRPAAAASAGAAAGGAAKVSAGAAASGKADVVDASGAVVEWQWAGLLFDAPIQAPLSSMVIGSHLDSGVDAAACRIAFHGRLAEALASSDIHELRRANIYKKKVKKGAIDRNESKDAGAAPSDPLHVIGKNLFKKETDMGLFVGLKVYTKYGQEGTIDAPFGKSGKFKASFPHPRRVHLAAVAEAVAEDVALASTLPAVIAAALERYRSGGASALAVLELDAAAVPVAKGGEPLFLRFRKYMYAPAAEKGAAGLVQ